MKPYYETPNGKLYHGNCLDIVPELEPVDLVLTDPPYRIHAKSGGGFHNKRTWLKNVHNAKIDVFEPKHFLFLLEAKKILNPFHAYIFSSKDLLEDYISWFRATGLSWELLIYAKRNPIPTKNNKYLSDKEYCFFVRTPNKCYFNNGLAFRKYKTVQNVSVTKNEHHPAEKDIGYIIDRIEISSKETDIILDPYLGSGSVGIACERLNRRWIGIEISKEYCEIAAKRIENERKQLKMF
jgi:DNA modification methylase